MRFSRNWPSRIQVERFIPCHAILKLNLGFFFLQVEVQVDSANKHGILLLEAVQVLTDLNLNINLKPAYVSSDGR